MSRWDCAVDLQELDPAVAKERRRVLALIDAHQSHLGMAYIRLGNLIANGVDLAEEMELPIDERASGFRWPDER